MSKTAEILVSNTPDVFRRTFEDANYYQLVSLDTKSERYVTTMKFLVGKYDVKLQFVTQEHGSYSFTKTPIKVYCSCLAYFYYALYANRKHKCDCSPPRLQAYRKKTDRIPLNALNLPICCKHLYHLLRELEFDGVLTETVKKATNQAFLNSALLEDTAKTSS